MLRVGQHESTNRDAPVVPPQERVGELVDRLVTVADRSRAVLESCQFLRATAFPRCALRATRLGETRAARDDGKEAFRQDDRGFQVAALGEGVLVRNRLEARACSSETHEQRSSPSWHGCVDGCSDDAVGERATEVSVVFTLCKRSSLAVEESSERCGGSGGKIRVRESAQARLHCKRRESTAVLVAMNRREATNARTSASCFDRSSCWARNEAIRSLPSTSSRSARGPAESRVAACCTGRTETKRKISPSIVRGCSHKGRPVNGRTSA